MAHLRTCEHCGGPIPLLARADVRYCSGRCRVAALRARRRSEPVIPAELRARDCWVRHVRKRPVTVDGRQASVTNAATWTSYDDAQASTVGDGLGFVLDGDGIVCIDLDHCLHRGRLTSWGRAILESMPATYIERSPSGSGLHVWGLGNVERGHVHRFAGGAVEVYGRGRYMTVTGDRWSGSPSKLARVPLRLALP